MKKIILMLAFVASFVTANASDYKFLTVQQSNGTEQSFTASGLTITFSSGNMVINENGTSTTISLAGLSKMYFSDESTGIKNLTNEGEESVEVFDLQGRRLPSLQGGAGGKFSQLPKGVYIVKQGDRSFKITVK